SYAIYHTRVENTCLETDPSRPHSLPARKKFPAPAQRIPCPAAQGIWCNAPELLGELTPASAESDRRCGNSLPKSLPAGNSVIKSSPASDSRSTRYKFILHCPASAPT